VKQGGALQQALGHLMSRSIKMETY